MLVVPLLSVVFGGHPRPTTQAGLERGTATSKIHDQRDNLSIRDWATLKGESVSGTLPICGCVPSPD
jgi:hypothetical protein